MSSVLVVGDTHGEWAYLESLLLYYRPNVCIVAGDFGWWPGWGMLPQEALPREVLKNSQLYFIDGNHENHNSLIKLAPRGYFKAVEVAENIVFQPRGSLMELPDGRTVLFAGGAKSIDWMARKKDETWFSEELLLREHLPEKLPKVDVVISHTVPNAFGVDKNEQCDFFSTLDNSKDISQATLDVVLNECTPSVWVAGHFHQRIDGRLGNVEYHILDKVRGGVCMPEGLPCMFWLTEPSVLQ